MTNPLRRIPGFRTRTRWKQILASVVYSGVALFVLLLVLGLATEGSAKQPVTQAALAPPTVAPAHASTPAPAATQAVAPAIQAPMSKSPTPLASSATNTPAPTATPLPPTPTVNPTQAAIPAEVVAHLGAANSFVQAKNYPAALKEYAAALALDPTSKDALAGQQSAMVTATAIPAATAAAVRAVVHAYATLMGPRSDAYVKALRDVLAQNQKAVTFPSLMADATWKSDMAAKLITLQADGAQLDADPAPTELGQEGALLADVHAQTDAFVHDYARGLDALDLSLIHAAVADQDRINTDLQQAAAILASYAIPSTNALPSPATPATQAQLTACLAALIKVDKRASDFVGSPSTAQMGCQQSATMWFNPDGTMKVSMGDFCRQNIDESECVADGY